MACNLMSIGGCNDISYILRRLLEIEERLGGTQKLADSKGDEFDRIRTTILEKIYSVRGKMNEMAKKKASDRSRTADIVRLRMEIQDEMGATDQLLQSLKKILKNQQSNPKITQVEKGRKAELTAKLDSLYMDMRDEVEGKEVGKREREIQEQKDKEKQDQTEVLGGGTGKSREQDFRYQMSQLHQDEDLKLKEWKAFDEKLDGKLDDINILLDEIKEQAVQQGEKMKDIKGLIGKVDKQLMKTSLSLDTQNSRLKDLVKKYRAPSRFCLDMIIFIFIIGLIGIIVNMIK